MIRSNSGSRLASPHAVVTALSIGLAACGGSELPAVAPAPAASAGPLPEPTSSAAPTPDPMKRHAAVERTAFNKSAVRLNLPLYWSGDKNGNGAIEPDEAVLLLFHPTSTTARWVEGGAFTPAFEEAYERIAKDANGAALAGLSGAEAERRKLVLEELDQGRATLVSNDLSALPADEKTFVKHVLAAADLIDDLYGTMTGAKALAGKVSPDDPASASVFRRNWGPKCLQPLTEKKAPCTAIAGAPKPICDAYPAALQSDPAFCKSLEKLPNAKALLEPFVVVREKGNALEAVPYSVAYKEQMEPIAKELRAAADALPAEKEKALKAYLVAAAQSFLDNNWLPADEAWAKMSATNSAWYLRVGPDEVYWDPCDHKAGFHVTLARINKDSLAWQDKLVPTQQAMEKSLATLIGKPYAARKVTFHLPDFIDIVINAGDDRKESGATIGQSLPNWGPVANEGRGRTVAMSNLYTDPDSQKSRRNGAESVLTKESMTEYVDSDRPGLLSTILHEASHNLGPAHEYKFKGKTDAQWFGGGLASMMEELKAQTGALYLVEFLKQLGIIDAELARRTYTDSIVWGFGHISRGMYTATGNRKPYSQLAAIQIGFLIDQGAITWDAKTPAANAKDEGAFTIHFDKLPAAIDKMMKTVGGLKATGDKAGAEALARKYVDGDVVPQALITERLLRNPRATFVYALTL
jgi:hypothetical protein